MATIEISVRSVGQAFGCVADLRDATTGKLLATTKDVRPYRNRAAAYADGEALAAKKGWAIKAQAA